MEKKFRRWLVDCHSRLDKHVRFERIGPPELQVQAAAVCCVQCSAVIIRPADLLVRGGLGRCQTAHPIAPSGILLHAAEELQTVAGRCIQACTLQRKGCRQQPSSGWEGPAQPLSAAWRAAWPSASAMWCCCPASPLWWALCWPSLWPRYADLSSLMSRP